MITIAYIHALFYSVEHVLYPQICRYLGGNHTSIWSYMDVAWLTTHMKAALYTHRSPVDAVAPTLDIGIVFFVDEGTWALSKQWQIMMAW